MKQRCLTKIQKYDRVSLSCWLGASYQTSFIKSVCAVTPGNSPSLFSNGHLFGAKLLPEPMLTNCQWDSWENIFQWNRIGKESLTNPGLLSMEALGTNSSETRIRKKRPLEAGMGSRLAHELLQLSCIHANNTVCSHVNFAPNILHTSVAVDI